MSDVLFYEKGGAPAAAAANERARRMAPIPRKQAGSRTAANDTATSSATTITLSGGQPEKQPERRGAWAKHWGLAVNRARKKGPTGAD